ncbi:MAG: hypothetical protein KF718_20390 [Polyangiaceae bacterium]|nr:hypothetical protein [Polyangiaceae bacterium]
MTRSTRWQTVEVLLFATVVSLSQLVLSAGLTWLERTIDAASSATPVTPLGVTSRAPPVAPRPSLVAPRGSQEPRPGAPRRVTLELEPAAEAQPRYRREAPRVALDDSGRAVLSRVDGTLAALGLRSGDRLLDINGIPLVGPNDALRAYSEVRRAPRLSLGIERGGARVELLYHFH